MTDDKLTKGSLVWTFNEWSYIERCRVVNDVPTIDYLSNPEKRRYRLHPISRHNPHAFISCSSDRIFPSYTAAMHALQQIAEDSKNRYRNEIPSKKDLLTFMFTHPCTGDDIDYNARDVVVEKCKELFDIDIEKESDKICKEINNDLAERED